MCLSVDLVSKDGKVFFELLFPKGLKPLETNEIMLLSEKTNK